MLRMVAYRALHSRAASHMRSSSSARSGEIVAQAVNTAIRMPTSAFRRAIRRKQSSGGLSTTAHRLRPDRRDLRDVLFQPQPTDGHLEAILHVGVVGVEVTGEAAVLELESVGILEVDRLGPVVVDHLGHLDALGD